MRNLEKFVIEISKSRAAQLLGMSVRTLNRRLESGHDFPRPWKMGGIVRFSRKAIEDYIRRKNLDREGQSD